MEYKFKYNIGDQVFKVVYDHKEQFKFCPSCEHGKITLKDKSIDCPTCSGKGVLQDYAKTFYRTSYNSLTIGQLRLEYGEEIKEEYMCEETGVGSGTIHYQKDLFTTRELAQAECDTKNNIENTSYKCHQCNLHLVENPYSHKTEWMDCSIHGKNLHLIMKNGDLLHDE